MAVTIAAFKVQYPEFALAGDAMLTAVLQGTEATTGADGFGTEAERDEYVMLALAHALALSPMGRDARLSNKDGTTTYGTQMSAMRDANACLNPNRWGST